MSAPDEHLDTAVENSLIATAVIEECKKRGVPAEQWWSFVKAAQMILGEMKHGGA